MAWYGTLCQNACGQAMSGLCDQFLAGVAVALVSEYSRPIHRWGEDMVRLSSAGESDSPWHGWRQSPPAGSVGENDSRPLYLFTKGLPCNEEVPFTPPPSWCLRRGVESVRSYRYANRRYATTYIKGNCHANTTMTEYHEDTLRLIASPAKASMLNHPLTHGPDDWFARPSSLELVMSFEATHGLMPASVREWFLIPESPRILFRLSRLCSLYPDEFEVEEFNGRLIAVFASDDISANIWAFRLDVPDDPQVLFTDVDHAGPWVQVSDTFSRFIYRLLKGGQASVGGGFRRTKAALIDFERECDGT